jgi:hypothetical protein
MRRGAIVIAGILALVVASPLLLRWWSSTSEWRAPIEFFGKVVDEKGAPLPSADIEFSCNDLSAVGTSNYHRTSDTNGLFSIRGLHGKLLVVIAAKTGYYRSRADNDAFYYAGQNVNFIPNRAKPEIFHLRQIGTAEPLIHIQSPLGGGKGFRIDTNGDPVQLSLRTGKIEQQGQADLRIQCWTKQLNGSWKYDWRFRVTVINGGLQEYTNEFPFEAPLHGYRAFDEIDMPASLGERWASTAKKRYFLRFGDGDYARMNLEIIPSGDHFVEVESFLNPSGSRNLEFDPKGSLQIEN